VWYLIEEATASESLENLHLEGLSQFMEQYILTGQTYNSVSYHRTMNTLTGVETEKQKE